MPIVTEEPKSRRRTPWPFWAALGAVALLAALLLAPLLRPVRLSWGSHHVRVYTQSRSSAPGSSWPRSGLVFYNADAGRFPVIQELRLTVGNRAYVIERWRKYYE